MRERVAIVFMTLSVAATISLGGLMAYEFGHSGHATALVPVTASVAGQAYTSAPGSSASAAGTPSSGGTPATPVVNAGAASVSAPSSAGGHPSATAAASRAPAVKAGRAPATRGARRSSPARKARPGATTSTPAATSTTAAAPTTTAAAGAATTTTAQGGGQPGPVVNGKVITVGGIYDETGPVDATVERDTVRSYFDLVNAQGGVDGYKLQLIDCDSKYDPSSAHQCAQKLISEGVLAIVGWLSLSGEQNEASYLTSQGVPIIGGLGVPSEYSSPLSFPTTPSLVTAGTALGTRAGQIGLKKPGVIFLNANFIQPVESSFLSAMKQAGITPVDVEQVDATKADYTDIALKFESAGAQSVAAFLDPFSYARLFQAMERQNWHVPVLGGGLDKVSANQQYDSGCGSSCAVFGADSATPVLEYLDHQSTPAINQYLSAVHTYYPGQYGQLDSYTTYQWLAAEVFVQAIKAIGNAPVNRQNLVNALDNIKNLDDGGITPPISYSPGSGHDPLHCFQWLHNTSGQWRTTSSWNCF